MNRIDERLKAAGINISNMTDEEKFKAATGFTWYEEIIAENPWYVPGGAGTVLDEEAAEQDETEETYTTAEAAAYNATLPGAKTTDDWKIEPVEAQEAVEAKNAVYSFESFGDAEATNKYGDGTVEVTEMRAGGATVKVLTNNALDPNAEDFVGQEFNVATGLATDEPIQLYTLQNEPINIWVTVELVSEAIEAQEAVEAVEGIKYTQEEADAYNAELDGAVKAGDKKVVNPSEIEVETENS